MFNITIDDKTIEVSEGTTVLQAARQAGIKISTLCDHPELTPFGGCRLCLVEVEGIRNLQPSCTLPVNNNMIVHTDSEKIHSVRKFVLTLIFSERNHFCPFCQLSGGDCELQNAALAEGMTYWPLQPNWQPYQVDASHPFIVIDHNRCILCRRCERACNELVGNFTLGFEERGAKTMLIADFGVPLGESSCISCGTCVQVCPTGSLIDRRSAYRGKETQVEKTASICIGCSIGCGIEILTRDNQLIRIEGKWDAPVNEGVICKIGRFLPMEENRLRLTKPMIRKNGTMQPASWDEALILIASKLSPLVGKNGVAALASTRLSLETLSIFKQIFVDHFKSANVTSIEEGQTTSLAAKLAHEMNQPFEADLAAIQNSDCAIVIGSNLVENHQVLGFMIKRNRPNGTSLIMIDPNPNPMDDLANVALKVKPASDIALLNGLWAALSRLGFAKIPFSQDIDSSIQKCMKETGVPLEKLLETAKLIASAKNPVIIYGKGILSAGNTATLKALTEFAQASGSKLLSVKGEANSLAASLLSLDKPFKLDGHKAVYLALGDDTPSQRLIQRLEKAPFLVVQASYTSQLTAMADVILPSATWIEEEGHFLNLEGRLQKAVKALNSPDNVWKNQTVLSALAEKLNLSINDHWKNALTDQVVPVKIIAS